MIKKGLTFLIFSLIAGSAGFFLGGRLFKGQELSPKPLSAEQIIAARDLAISEAVEAGSYRCCITPPCMMCFMEENQWNDFTAGTCACDDLIAQGKEPCPQCKRDLCDNTEEGTCKTNGGLK